jgi:GH15 family glucan-1,4-alpha-glucosidase
MKKSVLFFSVAILAGSGAVAQDYQRFYREGSQAAAEAARQNWASFTDEQKRMDRAIAAIYRRQKLALTDENLEAVMENIGANESDREFVANRMYWHYRAQTALGR